jgi:hypothetical protein
VLFDLPDVWATARGGIDRHIAAGRVEKVPGDFAEAVPPGADAYLLKWIVHDWDDEAAIRILTNSRTAMGPAGKVLLVEVVIPQRTAASDASRLDTTMLVFTGSSERTKSEYRDLLHPAGLTLIKTTPTASPFSILEATPAEDGSANGSIWDSGRGISSNGSSGSRKPISADISPSISIGSWRHVRVPGRDPQIDPGTIHQGMVSV